MLVLRVAQFSAEFGRYSPQKIPLRKVHRRQHATSVRWIMKIHVGCGYRKIQETFTTLRVMRQSHETLAIYSLRHNILPEILSVAAVEVDRPGITCEMRDVEPAKQVMRITNSGLMN